jgi:hypothetical protein
MFARRLFVDCLNLGAAAALCLGLIAGCDGDRGRPRAVTKSDHDSSSPVPPASVPDEDAECKPKCGAESGVGDGCGAKCGCAAGAECKEGVCIDPACGPCRPNERCAEGKCECVPDCEGRDCGDDGCGGMCACPDDLVLNAQGQAVPRADCHDTCESAAFQCGKLCGVDCGGCAAGQACDGGKCECVPKCDGSSCSDGCGGSCDCKAGTVCNAQSACVAPAACTDTCASTKLTCGTMCGAECGSCGDGQSCIDGACRVGTSCSDCNLQLRLLDRRVVSKKLVRVVLAVDFTVGAEDSGPRLLDVHVGADKVVKLVSAEAGPALLDTGKDLFLDESTQRTWQRRPDGNYRVLAYSLVGAKRVKSGRLMTLVFDLAESGPVSFSLLRHAQTFAPLEADAALQSSPYDQALVVTR